MWVVSVKMNFGCTLLIRRIIFVRQDGDER
jgi:hypothetical protein